VGVDKQRPYVWSVGSGGDAVPNQGRESGGRFMTGWVLG